MKTDKQRVMTEPTRLTAALLLALALALAHSALGCDDISQHFYKELGCVPVYTVNPLCPATYDCRAIELNRRLFCVVKNQAQGSGGKIEFGSGISNPCVPSCSCIQNYDQTVSRFRWQCTHSDCPQYFRPALHPGCFWQEELKGCCPWKKVCKKSLAKCSHKGVTYKENDRFYTFRGSECVKCVCKPGFNGTLSEPWCTEIGCDLELHDGELLARGCAPIYSSTFCCPIDWRCPDTEDTVEKGVPGRDEINPAPVGPSQCKFGDLLLNVGDSVLPNEEANCRCNIPPYVVCTSS